MKKLYMILAAIIMAVSVNAATVYFENTANWAKVNMYCWTGNSNDGAWPGKQMTETVEKDGKTYYKGETSRVSIIFNNGSGSQTSDLQVVDNMIYDASGSTGVTFEGEVVVIEKNFTLAGNFNGYKGDDSNYAFTKGEDNIHTLHLDSFAASSDFAIVENGASWYKYAAGPMESGVEYQLSTNGITNCTLSGAATDVTFEINAETYMAKVTYTTSGEVIELEYGIKGDIFGDPSWSVEQMTLTDGKWVLSDMTIIEGDFGIMPNVGGVQRGWIYAEGSANIVVLDQAMPCVKEGEGSGMNWHIAAGTYTFTFDPEAMTLTVTGEGGDDPDIDYTTWYLNVQGDFNNWNPTGVQFDAEGIAVATDLHIGTSEFEIKIWNGKKDLYYAVPGEVQLGQEYTLSVNSGTKMTVAGATENSVYDVTFNAKTNVMKISIPTGVETIEADETEAVYYNLQGVRVDNPANGIFVRVANGKAAKVVK